MFHDRIMKKFLQISEVLHNCNFLLLTGVNLEGALCVHVASPLICDVEEDTCSRFSGFGEGDMNDSYTNTENHTIYIT